MTEAIVVSDANIFIDLFASGCLNNFFDLPWEIHTTRAIILELRTPGLQEAVLGFVTSGNLVVHDLREEYLDKIVSMNSENFSGRVSVEDMSVLLISQINGYILLTGDRRLRRRAEAEDIEVHGILFIVKEIVSHNTVTKDAAREILNRLVKSNGRLPKKEISEILSRLLK